MRPIKFLQQCKCGQICTENNTRFVGEQDNMRGKVVLMYSCKTCHSSFILKEKSLIDQPKEAL